MKIFYVNGVATSGKDTFIQAVTNYCEGQVGTFSTVDEVKVIARERFGWDGVKDEKGRALLSALRFAWGTYNNGPVEDVGRRLKFFAESMSFKAFFVQSREFPEIMKMQERFGGQTINILRPGIEIGETEQGFLEMVPDYFDWDIELINNGSLDDWCETIKEFIEGELR